MFNSSKDIVTRTFDHSAEDFDEIGTPFFKLYGKRLADLANIQKDDVVLDIACGKGATAFPMAEKCSGKGKIIAIDISTKMIEQCKKLSNKTGVRNIDFLVMDAERLEFEDESFNKVVCGFGLFFLPDIEKGFKEICRVLKKDGVLLFSSWNKDFQLKWLNDLISKYIPGSITVQESMKQKIQDSDFRTIDGLEKVLANSNFQKDIIQTENIECFYNDEREWIATRWQTAFRMFFEKMSKNDYKQFEKEMIDCLQNYKENGKIKITNSAFLTRAKKLVD